MDPQIWGKHGWIFLHSVTMAYPDRPTEDDKHNYRTFFNVLPTILPCGKCRINLNEHMSKLSLESALTDKKSLVKWLISIHNETNATLGKPTLTYEKVIEMYKQLYNQSKSDNKIELFTNTHSSQNMNNSQNVNNSQNNIYYISFAIILGIIIIALFIWKKRSVLFA